MKARNNPFRSEAIHRIRYRFQSGSLASLLVRLEKLQGRAALVGPEGSGKTTLLEDLERAFRQQGRQLHWFRLTREFPRFSQADRTRLRGGFSPNDTILFDGAEILGRLGFQRFRWQTRGAGRLIITTHRSGYLPTLLQTGSSAELLREIVGQLDPSFPPCDFFSLFRRHRGNLREALRELYEIRHRITPTEVS